MARLWKRRIRKARRQAEKLGHYIEVRYEDLVLETEPTLRRVADFIDLDWDDAMLRYHEQSAERMAEMDRRPPGACERPRAAGRAPARGVQAHLRATQKARVERWREQMDTADVQAFEDTAGDLLAELGYETGAGQAS